MNPRGKDDFIQATAHLFTGLPRSPSFGVEHKKPFALDGEARLAELEEAGFINLGQEMLEREVRMTTAQTLALYRTFSQIATATEAKRNAMLEALEVIVERDFGGVVTRTIATPVFYAQKPEAG